MRVSSVLSYKASSVQLRGSNPMALSNTNKLPKVLPLNIKVKLSYHPSNVSKLKPTENRCLPLGLLQATLLTEIKDCSFVGFNFILNAKNKDNLMSH